MPIRSRTVNDEEGPKDLSHASGISPSQRDMAQRGEAFAASRTARFGSFGEDRSCSQRERSEWDKRRAASSRRLDSPRRSIGHPIPTRYVAAYRFRCLIAANNVDDNASASGASCIRNVSAQFAGGVNRARFRGISQLPIGNSTATIDSDQSRSAANAAACAAIHRAKRERERERFFESFSFELRISFESRKRASSGRACNFVNDRHLRGPIRSCDNKSMTQTR